MSTPNANQALPPEIVIERFQRRPLSNGAQKTHQLACDLLLGILSQHRFETVDQLICFCREPDNLRDWLTSEAERILMANELERGLTETVTDPV